MTGVKGRIQTRIIHNDDGSRKKKTEIVAEKVTFLAQSPNSKEIEKQPKKNKTEKKKK